MKIYLGILFLMYALIGCTSNKPHYTKVTPSINASISNSNVKDTRSEFRTIFCTTLTKRIILNSENCGSYFYPFDNALQKYETDISDLPRTKNKLVFAVVPGIFGECLIKEVAPFEFAMREVSHKYIGVRFVLLDKLSGRASSKYNSRVIHNFVNNLSLQKGEKLVLLGYSKGVTDSLHYLNEYYYKGQSSQKIHGFVSVAGVVNGTSIANDLDGSAERLAATLPLKDCPTKDESGISSLSLYSQMKWMEMNAELFKKDMPMFSLVTASTDQRTSAVFIPFRKELFRSGGLNDGQVNASNQVLPNSYLLGYMNADHWAVILPFGKKNKTELSFLNKFVKKTANKNDFPRDVLLESIVRIVDEKIDPNK